jgi:RNA polymerase sigma-70 factor (ECF subfamily)
LVPHEAQVDEGELIERARQGSEEAFSSLLRLHQGRVRSFVACHLHAWDVVDDLAQDVFLAAYRDLESYRAEGSFAHWLLGIARYKVLMHLREEERRRCRESGTLESLVAGLRAGRLESETVGTAIHERKLTALEGCLEKLPDPSAKLLAAYYARGGRSEDLARSQGKSGSALRMTILKIRKALRECISLRLGDAGASA